MCSAGFARRVRETGGRWRAAVLAALLLGAASRASAAPCTPVPVYDAGWAPGVVCAEASGRELVLVSLDDGWVPRVLSETPVLPQAYRGKFLALANERLESEGIGPEQRRDRYFELFGIFPSIGVVRRRLLDAERHACHARVDDAGLRELEHTLTLGDRELVRLAPDGRWMANHRAVGPGYASAYGLVALLHHRAATPAGGPPWVDVNVRTHGSGSYRSILRGSSHGCHRLFNHLAIRLGSFLLAQGGAMRLGQSSETYTRAVRWGGSVYRLHAASRGYRFELSPPIDVHVLPGPPARPPRSSAPGAVYRAPGAPASSPSATCG